MNDSLANTNAQESRKRCHEDNQESEDSFDAPVEFVSIPDAKRTRFSTPSKGSLKRSSSITVTPSKEAVISDWEDSPIKEVNDSRNILSSLGSGQKSSSQDTFSSLGLEQDKENCSRDSFDDDVSFRSVTPVKRAPKRALSSGIPGFPSLGDESIQVLLTVKEIRREDGLVDLICTNSSGQESVVYLQNQWADIAVDEGMKIRLIGPQKWGDRDFLLSDQGGVMIVQPDILVPCTSVAGANWCPRKVLLNERFKGINSANKAMLIGCIMHELFQIAVLCAEPSLVTHDWLLHQWKANISSSVMEAFAALNFSPKMFETELIPYAQVIVGWVKSNVPSSSSPEILFPLPTGSRINAIHDIEENIWEPLIGVKGKIDTSLATACIIERQIEALELKTGKSGASIEHSTQVYLYSMMLSIRYEQPICTGSLLYLKDGVNAALHPRAVDLKGILQQRNNIAYFMSQNDLETLPEPRRDPHFCGKCEQALTCSIYQARKGTEGATEKFASFARAAVAHLNEIEKDYFKKWSDGIFAEHLQERRSRGSSVADLWNIDPDTREAGGHCAAHMTLNSCEKKEGYVLLRFERADPVREGVFYPGGMCTISSNDKYGISLCCIAETDEKSIVLRCERQFFLLKMGRQYHLDAYSSYSTYASTLGNVLTLMLPAEASPISARHRKLIIDLEKPSFAQAADFDLPVAASQILASANLNKGQKDAVLHALRAKEYSLIEGLPGAGKTTTIAVLIRCLVASGMSVLLTSYTNSAVDTVLSKLLKDMASKQLLRLGRVSGSSEEVSALSLKEKLKDFTTEKELYQNTRKILKDTSVVACTCHHTSREMLFSWRTFDICIVDEASMVLEPVVLSALAAASRFVMVGDTRQLAPLVLDRKSREAGLAVSLFERLQTHREAVTSLVEQFRMNREISSIASRLFYEGRLVCATEAVANATLSSIPTFKYDGEDPVLSPEMEDSCVFVDTASDKNPAMCVIHKGGVYNDGEAAAVVGLVEKFKESGVPSEEIGVMCVYRRQVEVIRGLLEGVEVNTVDQYQGRDKAVIIWSLVWTEDSEKKCELLNDARRVNVALTRAKNKLVIVGCQKSMQKIEVMAKLTPLVKSVPL